MSEFKREERYIVVKLKHLAGLQVAPLRNFLRENRVPTLDCVVVEQDWPEYEKVWRSIERRMTGQPVEDFDRVTAERDDLRNEIGQVKGEYDRAVNKIDALQALLTAADERADEDDMVLRSSVPERHKGCTSPVGAVQSYIVELEGRADLLEALLRDARQYYGVTLLTDPPQDAWKHHRISERIDAALKP